ncbi:MAG: L,D-transpeptidase [Blastocatellia bacterium]
MKIVYRPVSAVNRYAELGTVTNSDNAGKFLLQWKPNADFTGDVWAEATWDEGIKMRSNVLALATEDAINPGGQIPLENIGNSVGTNESARSDKLTGGKLAKPSLAPGDGRIWITVDVPAFRLTLWQNGKEVTTYQIGVGRLDYQLPVGERKATEIVWNPDWIPPDSKWVTDVEPGEKIEADDPRNPLGKVKIRLGNGILIHEAAKPTDIGRLASHGCVRMLTDDLYDLTEKIVAARKLPVSQQQIEAAKHNTERLAIKLDPPLWVDVNYDTHVVEGGRLHLYPDVYKRDKDRLATLRQTLNENGVTQSDDALLKELLARVTRKEEFQVSLADLKAGRALEAGHTVPLVDVPERKPEA